MEKREEEKERERERYRFLPMIIIPPKFETGIYSNLGAVLVSSFIRENPVFFLSQKRS